MNYFKNIYGGALLSVGVLLAGCSDPVEISDPNWDYGTALEVRGMLKSPASPRDLAPIELTHGEGQAELVFSLSKGAKQGIDVVLKVDPSLVDAYNKEHMTDYEAYPADLVTLEEEGAILIAPSDVQSDPVTISLVAPSEWGDARYLLPIRAEVVTEGVKLVEDDAQYLFSVLNVDERPNADKGTGFVTICYIEVNSDNPLNPGEYKMKSTGKPFVDIVNIFAANINYDVENCRPYVHCNDNVQYILNHRDQFIKPLQDKGIRVSLSILGNHDEAGLAGLTDAMAIDFAYELKAFVDTYGLDGVDFDDEWSSYNPDGVLWPEPSRERYARLIYECRKLMPDKLITVYDIGSSPTGSVDGMEVGKMIDYSYQPYYGTWSDAGLANITGMKRSQYGPYPLNIRGGLAVDADQIKRLRYNRYSGMPLGDPYGVNLLYCMDATDYEEAFNTMGEILFDDGVEWSGNVYDKFAIQPRKLK